MALLANKYNLDANHYRDVKKLFLRLKIKEVKNIKKDKDLNYETLFSNFKPPFDPGNYHWKLMALTARRPLFNIFLPKPNSLNTFA